MSFGSSNSKFNMSKNVDVSYDSEKIGSSLFENKLKVLVVDDGKINRLIVTTHLAKLGVESQEAENGKEVIDLFLAGASYDLILIDKEMPIMDGIEATKILRSMGVRTKMVGVSAHSAMKDKAEFLEAGIDEYHEKPMNRNKLIALLQEVDKKH